MNNTNIRLFDNSNNFSEYCKIKACATFQLFIVFSVGCSAMSMTRRALDSCPEVNRFCTTSLQAVNRLSFEDVGDLAAQL